MKLLIICSKHFYSKIEGIKEILENRNIDVFLPNCYNDPNTEEKMWNLGREEHQKFKEKMYKQKSRQQWVNAGDQNTSYFHRHVAINRK